MSKRSKQRGSLPRPDVKTRRLLQLIEQRQLQQKQQRLLGLYRTEGGELPDKQHQDKHNPVTEGLPFGLFTSDQ